MCFSVLSAERMECASQLNSFTLMGRLCINVSSLFCSPLLCSVPALGVDLSAAAVEVVNIEKEQQRESYKGPEGQIYRLHTFAWLCADACVYVERKIPQEGSELPLLSRPSLRI